MAAVGKPLRLKDLLELDCDSCSAAGFRCYPRHLCVAVPLPARHEAPEAHSVFGRSHSLLSIRSLSRRLRGSFSWGRRDEDEPAPAPVPAVSSCSSSDSETSVSGSSAAESDFSTACSAESRSTGVTAAAVGHEQEAMERGSKEEGSGSEADDKEQLSPVAVMDFPFHDDDDNDDAVEDGGTSDGGSACSPSPFGDSLAQLHQRRNIQLKHKLRRLRSIGEAPAADLGERFAAASESDGLGSVPAPDRFPDDDAAKQPSLPEAQQSVDALCQYPDEHSLIALLTRKTFSTADGSERLLLDFFAETRRLSSTTESCEAAVRLAQDWIEGTGARWGLKEALCGREDLLAEMDRGRRWLSRVREEEEEREVGVLVAGLVVEDLLRELVNDMLL